MKRRVLLALAALLVAALGAVGTLALWRGGDLAAPAVIRSGNLNVTVDGEPTWREISPDIEAAPRIIDPKNFLAMPGDVVEVSQPLGTDLTGDNLAGVLSVDWVRAPTLAVDATYRLERGGVRVAGPTRLGSRVELRDLPRGSVAWELIVELDLRTHDPAYVPSAGPSAPVLLADLGDVRVDLDQVRPGGS